MFRLEISKKIKIYLVAVLLLCSANSSYADLCKPVQSIKQACQAKLKSEQALACPPQGCAMEELVSAHGFTIFTLKSFYWECDDHCERTGLLGKPLYTAMIEEGKSCFRGASYQIETTTFYIRKNNISRVIWRSYCSD